MTTEPDIFDIAVTYLADDDWNHVPEATLRERLAAIRDTRMETTLEERADEFIREVRDTLTGWDPNEPEYGPESTYDEAEAARAAEAIRAEARDR